MKNKVLVLGASGMVGRTVFKFLSKSKSLSVFGTVKTKTTDNLFKFNFPNNNVFFNSILLEYRFNYIINCIGTLKNKDNKNYQINYLLPKLLYGLSKKYHFKIINISTDDVFDFMSGDVNEKSKPIPNNSYGISKLKGEIFSKRILNIRTSFIGFDPDEKKGLIEWIKSNKTKSINGYVNHAWSGCTTLQFAKLCMYLVSKNNFENLSKQTNILNFSPLGPITTYQLLKFISKSLNPDIKINKFKSQVINRNLYSIFFDRKFLNKYTTEINKAILELEKFEKL